MKKLEIEIPNDKEIDWEASAKQKQIVFKDKQLTYEDVCNKLFAKEHYFIDVNGDLRLLINAANACPNNASTRHQLECILAKNKLANVARYLNGDWKPNLDDNYVYCLTLTYAYHSLEIERCGVVSMISSGKVIFKSKELAQQAIKILGKETVKLALEPLY